MTHATALMVGIVEEQEFASLRKFAHEKFDEWIDAVKTKPPGAHVAVSGG